MTAQQELQIPRGLATLVASAVMLRRVERSQEPLDPRQYMALASQVIAVLRATPQGDGLQAVLSAFPSTSELYENANYEHAGLCRSPLEFALGAERMTALTIAKAMTMAPTGAEVAVPKR
jgi:hypothetical protein